MGKDSEGIRTKWYVVQVTTGSEDHMCEVISRACDKFDAEVPDAGEQVGLKECFNPKFESRKKRMGEWHDVERTLLPGYVVANVRNPVKLAIVLGRIEDFGRLLATDETYSPLDEAEREWLESYTEENRRIVPLSYGFRDGDSFVVARGPLKGREATITRLDRKNCLAHIELHAGSVTFKKTLGLVILPSGDMQLTEDGIRVVAGLH